MSPMATHVLFDQSQLDVSRLQGRSVLITGGASGIGLACATKIAEAGALVTISDRQETTGHAVVQDLIQKGNRVQFVHCDVTSYAGQVNMFQSAIQFGEGRIDIVIPNAGVVAERSLFEMIPQAAPTINSPPPSEPGFVSCTVNLQAVYNTCYLAMHYFRLPRDPADTYKPSIVLISSLAGYIGYPSSTTYSMSKFGVRGLFYAIRDGAAPAFRVNLVAPWFVKTAMTTAPDFVASETSMLLNFTGFAPMERVQSAVMQFCANENLHGRAAGIFPMANEDLGDDLEGSYSGVVLEKHMKDIMAKVMKGMADMEAQKNELAR
ncbi:hypothetical protein GQ44DRAFT_743827 [Phaeosphaeriaceae sp. PMI808]|nr:hypothetical protein GQ44DRAFT_743827 [Phaeosphaeriaceae sp. PMI808]